VDLSLIGDSGPDTQIGKMPGGGGVCVLVVLFLKSFRKNRRYCLK
jgi:hypothetical protein